MPLYYFDVHDAGAMQRDETGTDFAIAEEVIKAARGFLPDVAREEIPKNGDCRHFVVLVRDQHGNPFYSATLAFTGLRLR